jgi:hypothetical protein
LFGWFLKRVTLTCMITPRQSYGMRHRWGFEIILAECGLTKNFKHNEKSEEVL